MLVCCFYFINFVGENEKKQVKNMRTFYDILRVSRYATREQILIAYKQRCLEVHPDKGGSDLEFINVKRAFNVLSDPQTRAKYDNYILLKEKQELEREIEKLRENLGRKSSNQTAKQNAANNTTWKSSSGDARKYYHDSSKKTEIEYGIRQLLILMLLVIGAVAIAFVFFDGKSLIDAINTEQNAYGEHSASPKETNTYTETNYFTGESPYSSYYTDERDINSLSELTISNLTSTDAVVLLVSFRGEVIRNVFISQDSEYTIAEIPVGRYKVKVMYGNAWNSDKDNGEGFPRGGFMKNVSFSETQSSDSFDFIPERRSDGVSYPTYSMTLHKVQNGNLDTKRISKGDFFQ